MGGGGKVWLTIPFPYNSDDIINYFLLASLIYDKVSLSTNSMDPCLIVFSALNWI